MPNKFKVYSIVENTGEIKEEICETDNISAYQEEYGDANFDRPGYFTAFNTDYIDSYIGPLKDIFKSNK